MSWIGQIALGAYVMFILGTVTMLFATILLVTCALPTPGGGAASRVLPGRKTSSTRLQ